MKAIQWTGTTRQYNKIKSLCLGDNVVNNDGSLLVDGHMCKLNDILVIDDRNQLIVIHGAPLL